MSLPTSDTVDESGRRTDAKILMPGEGPTVAIRENARCTFKIVGDETDGMFGLFEYRMQPGTAGPKPHIHRKMEEIFYVAEGKVAILVDDRQISAPKGTLAFVPRGAVHAFANPGKAAATLLIMFCPAASREKYFQGLAALTEGGRIPDKEALVDLMRENDQEPVEIDGWAY